MEMTIIDKIAIMFKKIIPNEVLEELHKTLII